MECYNISFSDRAQAPDANAGAGRTPARWPLGSRPRHGLPSALAAALILHAFAGAALLTVVRLVKLPETPPEPTLTMVFEVMPEPAVQPAPEPPQQAEPPPPREQPVPDTPPPDQPPPDLPPPEQPPLAVPPPEPAPVIQTPPPPPPKPRVAPRPVARPTPPPAAPAPAAEAPPPAAPPAQPAAQATPLPADWERSLSAWLTRHRVYPDAARRRGIEGKVTLRLTIDHSGRVTDVAVVHSAGAEVLDTAAQDMVRNASLPPFPAEVTQDRVVVTVQIRYALTN